MQLKDFISTALIEICSGIAEAKAQIGNAAIAPANIRVDGQEIENTHSIEQIGFEISVTVDNTNTSKNINGSVEIGILQVVSAKIGKNANEEKSNTTNVVNKITFNVPYMPALINKSKK